MNVKSPERIQKQYLKTTNSLASSYQMNGEKRLKSLDSRTSIQNRHLYSYQIYSNKQDRTAGSATGMTAQNQADRFIEMSRAQADRDRSSSIGEKERRYGSEGGDLVDSQLIRPRDQSLGNNASKKRQKKNQTMQVFVKVRPLNQKELQGKNGNRKIIKVGDEKKFVMINSSEANKSVFSQTVRDDKLFELNRAFGEECSNDEVFDYVMKGDLKQSLFEGYNCTCFVYGMTGAGKTYTMFGDICNYMTMNSSVKGLIMLSLKEIINLIKEKTAEYADPNFSQKRLDTYNDDEQEKEGENSDPLQSKQISFRVKLSYLEIYNEQIHDLLSDNENNDNLMVIEDPQRGVFVPELLEQEIITEQQVLECIRQGNTRRQMASTGQNEFSSRSHAIITFTIEQTISIKRQDQADASKIDYQNTIANNKSTVITSKLCLVDLAGSERAAVTENKGLRLQEGANINRSLLALGNCINILSDTTKKGAFVPYRDSKLTRLLKDSLGGNTQTYMIACVSPAFVSFEETLNTLKYAQRARKIQKIVTKNEKTLQGLTSQKSLQYISLIENMKKEIDFLKQQLATNAAINTNQSSHQSTANFAQESQLNQHAQEVGGLILLKEKSSNQISSSSDIFANNVQNNIYYPNNIELSTARNNDIKRSQQFTSGVPSLQLQKQDSTTSAQMSAAWQDNDSFSSSGKSVRISCTNTSNNGSVILFKRSPSQLNFTKQQQIHQLKVSEEMNQLSGKILKNLEENWEIQQSLQELNNLKRQNEEILEEKQQRLKKLKGNLIQWPHESEMNQLQIGITQLQNTMTNNQSILENMQQAFRRNIENKNELAQQMVCILQSSSDQLVKTMTQTCQVLQVEKNDLENANLDLKQQHLHFQTQFEEKVCQIKTMEEQIKLMKKALEEKDQIIQQNQQVIQHLAHTSNSLPSHMPNDKLNSYNTSAINNGNQFNQSNIFQTVVSKQNGTLNPNSVFNPFSSQPSMTSCPFNQSSFFLTTVTNNGNPQSGFNPFLSQADQNIQSKALVEGSGDSGSGGNKNKNSGNETINGDYMMNNFMQNQSAIVQPQNHQTKSASNPPSMAPFYSNSSAIYLTNVSNSNTTNSKGKDAKRQVSSDANPNSSSNKLQIQMLSSMNGSFNQANILRSTSSQNTSNKKFFIEKNGYFDFKNKQNQTGVGQQSSTTGTAPANSGFNSQLNSKTTTLASTQNSKNPTLQTQNSMITSTGPVRNTPASPQMRVQSPILANKTATIGSVPAKKPISSNSNSNINTNTPSSNTTNTTTNPNVNKSTTTTVTQSSNNQQTFSSPTQSSARLSTMYKSPASITSSIVNRKSVLTHRDKQVQNVKNNSSGGVGTLSSFPNNNSTINPSVGVTSVSNSSKPNGITSGGLQTNSITKLGLNSAISSNNNISQLNNQTNNMSINANNNSGNANISNNNGQATKKLQDARNEYKEFINIFRKIHKEDEDNSQLGGNLMHSTLDEKFKLTSNNNNLPSNEYDLFPNASTIYQSKTNMNNNGQGIKPFEDQQIYQATHTSDSPLPKRSAVNKNIANIISSSKKDNPDMSLSDFLQTDEFPEFLSSGKNAGVERMASQERINFASKNPNNNNSNNINILLNNKRITEPFNKEINPVQGVQDIITAAPILTASSLHQKPHSLPPQQHLSPLYSTSFPKPPQSNINLSTQQTQLTPPQNTPSSSSLSKFTTNLATSGTHRRNDSITRALQSSSTQKESNIVTPDHSVSIHKIDLYKDKDHRSTPLGLYSSTYGSTQATGNSEKVSLDNPTAAQSQMSTINLYQEIHRLDNLILQKNVNSETIKDIQNLLQQLQAPQNYRLTTGTSEQAAIERFKQVITEQNYKSDRPNQSASSHGALQSYLTLSQQRVKSFGLTQKSLNEKENNSTNQNKYQSLSPNKKVNHLVQDVIEKQKKKRSQEFQRHLMLSNLASNIFNSDSDIDVMQTQTQTQIQTQLQTDLNTNPKMNSPTNMNKNEVNGLANISSYVPYKSNVININLYQNKNQYDSNNIYNSSSGQNPLSSTQNTLSSINQTNLQYNSQTSQPSTYSAASTLTVPISTNANTILASSQAVAQLNSTPIASLNLMSQPTQQLNYNSITSTTTNATNNNLSSGTQSQTQPFTNNIYKDYTQQPFTFQ